MLGVHLDMELEADSALPRLHQLGKLLPAVFTLTESLSALGSDDGEHPGLLAEQRVNLHGSGQHWLHEGLAAAKHRQWLQEVKFLHFALVRSIE